MIKIGIEDVSLFNYESVVVPSTMRSLYWKYFGFPADRFNNIITRSKIVCTLCNSLITHNKNTSNLRTHLVAKHADTLFELNNERKLRKKVTEEQSKQKTLIMCSNNDHQNQNKSLLINKKRIKISPKISLLSPSSLLESENKKEIMFDDAVKSTVAIHRRDSDSIIEDIETNENDIINKDKKIIDNISSNYDGVISTIEVLQSTDIDDIHNEKACISSDNFDNITQERRMIETKLENVPQEITEFLEESDFRAYSITLSSINDKQNHSIKEIQNIAPTTSTTAKSTSINLIISKSIDTSKDDTINVDADLLNVIIKGLLPFSIFQNNVFRQFINELKPDYVLPKIFDIQMNLQKIYEEKFQKIDKAIKKYSNKCKFSLSMEIWNNIEKKTLLSIYFNFNRNILQEESIEDESENSPILINIVYKTIELKQKSSTQDILELFNGINLENCVAAIVNKQNDLINEFLIQNSK